MAIPRKHSRIITVDGIRYRWILSREQVLCPADFRVMVELAECPRSVLVADPQALEPDFGDDYNYQITPALIATGIRRALSDGWDPSAGGTFSMRVDRRW